MTIDVAARTVYRMTCSSREVSLGKADKAVSNKVASNKAARNKAVNNKAVNKVASNRVVSSNKEANNKATTKGHCTAFAPSASRT